MYLYFSQQSGKKHARKNSNNLHPLLQGEGWGEGIKCSSCFLRVHKFSILYILVLLFVFAGNSLAKTPIKALNKALGGLVITDHPGSELQLEVRQMPLAQVLASIAKQTHVPIHYSVLPEGLVTSTCVGSTLKPVLECLLNRKADLIVRYSRNMDKAHRDASIVEAWILGSKIETVPVSNFCTAKSETGSMTLGRNTPEEESEHEPRNVLLQVVKSGTPAERADAIGALLAVGHDGDPAIKAALEEALHDQNANVRAQAISTLIHRGDNKESALAAIQEAMQDSSVDVRMMAVDGITDDVALLQQAINDSDTTIRDLATMKLEELMQRNKGKP
jgi:hypothetical protein